MRNAKNDAVLEPLIEHFFLFDISSRDNIIIFHRHTKNVITPPTGSVEYHLLPCLRRVQFCPFLSTSDYV
jgi:hypothetical protein